MSSRSPAVVVITGASAGVGRATARRFARDGAKVALLARGRDRLDEARRELEGLGGRALVVQADVADFDQVESAAQKVEERLGPIDVWINNAMATVFAPVARITPEEYRRATEVTYLGSVWGTMVALRMMRARGRGAIVQVGSALAYRSIPLQAPYCGAKHALVGFIDSLRSELQHEGSRITLTMVHLPAVNTPQFSWARSRMPRHPQPVPPIFEPEVAADAVHWAAHHPRRELYVGWPTLKAIWGQKLVPGWIDGYLARTGYEAQQTQEQVAGDRPDNLFAPVEGDYAAHGIFDDRARDHSVELWGAQHRWLLGLGAAAACALTAAAWRARRATS
jgi:NAD(P)-dependent dehydrogenase (short-subunit alcohol dehydrogenase family)